jgi:Flp pilus assembly protein TadG
MTGPGRASGERGSAAIEAVIGVPAFLLFVSLIILAGRVAGATQAVQTAAAAAAREASIARTPATAAARAASGAAASLQTQNVRCVRTAVSVDTSGFTVPVGTPAFVAATLTCVVPVADLALPGLPGTHTVTVTARSPLDTYRER